MGLLQAISVKITLTVCWSAGQGQKYVVNQQIVISYYNLMVYNIFLLVLIETPADCERNSDAYSLAKAY